MNPNKITALKIHELTVGDRILVETGSEPDEVSAIPVKSIENNVVTIRMNGGIPMAPNDQGFFFVVEFAQQEINFKAGDVVFALNKEMAKAGHTQPFPINILEMTGQYIVFSLNASEAKDPHCSAIKKTDFLKTYKIVSVTKKGTAPADTERSICVNHYETNIPIVLRIGDIVVFVREIHSKRERGQYVIIEINESRVVFLYTTCSGEWKRGEMLIENFTKGRFVEKRKSPTLDHKKFGIREGDVIEILLNGMWPAHSNPKSRIKVVYIDHIEGFIRFTEQVGSAQNITTSTTQIGINDFDLVEPKADAK